MPRLNRSEYIADDMFVHVRIQFNNGEFCFSNKSHYKLWRDIVKMYLKKYSTIKLCDYEWMSSHAHFILYLSKGEDLSKFMHDLCWRFAIKFNKMTSRKGHLFQQRYRCSVVNTDKYSMGCQRYIYRNQLRAKMVSDMDKTKWSSYHYYAYGKPDSLITPLRTYELYGNTPEKRQSEFRIFVEKMTEKEESLWRARLMHPNLKTKN